MEEKLFNDVYRRFVVGIFRYVYFKVSDYETANDLTADIFTKFWKLLKKETVANNKALLYEIARGIVIDYYRKKKNRKNISLEEIDERLLGTLDKSENNLETKQEINRIVLQLKKIKKEYQEVIILYYIEELTISEISFIFHKTENNTRVILHRALKALKKLL